MNMFPGRGGIRPNLGPGNRISNVTNSNDPHLMNCRVFVGNLNTFQLKKEDVENIFKKYGRITGISMHKGFAFVQFMNQRHARQAVAAEDQKIFAGQKLDVNISTEPKNKGFRKRPAEPDSSKFSNSPRMGNPMKRMRPDINPSMKRTLVPLSGPTIKPETPKVPQQVPQVAKSVPSTAGVQTYESPDILICGNCKSLFSSLDKLINHRKQQCSLRFMCKCSEYATEKQKKSDEPGSFNCASCNCEFNSCWELVKHCQNLHGLSIFIDNEQAEQQKTTSSETGQTDQKNKMEPNGTVKEGLQGFESESEEKEGSNGHEDNILDEVDEDVPPDSLDDVDEDSVLQDPDETS